MRKTASFFLLVSSMLILIHGARAQHMMSAAQFVPALTESHAAHLHDCKAETRTVMYDSRKLQDTALNICSIRTDASDDGPARESRDVNRPIRGQLNLDRRYNNKAMTRDSALREMTRDNDARREMTRDNDARREMTRDDEARREMTRDSARREMTRDNDARREMARDNEARREMTRDSVRREITRDNEARREMTRDSTRQEMTRDNDARREMTRDNDARREMTRDSARREMTSENDARRETTRNNDARREMTHDNDARREMTRVAHIKATEYKQLTNEKSTSGALLYGTAAHHHTTNHSNIKHQPSVMAYLTTYISKTIRSSDLATFLKTGAIGVIGLSGLVMTSSPFSSKLARQY